MNSGAGVCFGGNLVNLLVDEGTKLKLTSSGTPFNFPGIDGSSDQVLTTDGDGNLTFTAKGSGGGGGTCYGVSTEGGLTLTDGLCFAVVAGNNIVVSSNGVSLDTSLTGIESITMTTGGVSFSSNDTFIGRDGTSLRLISSGTPFNFPGIDGSSDQVLTTDGDGNLTFTAKGSGGGGGTCYGVSTEGGLSLTSGLCFAVVAGNNIVVSSDGVSLDTSLTGIESITMTTGGVSFSSNDTFIGRDGTKLRLISSGTPFNFPGIDGSNEQVLTTDGAGNLTFTTRTPIISWVLGADGTNNYTFTGSGFDGAVNDPDIYLVRGQKYKFVNNSGGHPFRIQSTVNGSTGTQYNDGITNNDAGNGVTLVWDVRFDSPDTLYYQCTSHGNMGGPIYILTQRSNSGGTCYGVSTEGGLSLTSGLCFAVVAGNNIVVSSDGVSLDTSLTGIESITMTTGGVSFSSNDTFIGRDGTSLRLISHGTPFNFPGVDGSNDQVLTTDGDGNLTFTAKGSGGGGGGGGTCYGVSTEGGLSLTSGLCFAVVAGNNIVVSSNGVSLDTSLTGIESITMTTGGVSFSSNDTFIGRDGTSLRLISSGTPFNFPGIDGSSDQVLTTDGDGNLTFTAKGSGGGSGGGTCYGVSTEGGLSLTSGLCFAVVAGNNIVVSSNGVSLDTSLTGIESITMTTGGVSFSSNDTFIGRDGTSLRLISSGTPFNFPGIDGSSDQVLTTDGDGNLTFTAKGSGGGGGGGGTCYGVSTEGGLSLTSGLCFAVVAGNNIVVSSDGVSLDTSLTGIESITMTTGGVSFSSNDTFIGRDGTSLRLISHGTPFNFPGVDGSNDQVLTTDGDGNLTFTAKGSGGGGGGGGTCYGVSTEGGLSLTSGLCFAVVAGNNIVVSSNGVSLDTSLTGIESITMTTGGVSFSSNDTFIGRDGTSLRLISHGTPFNFPGVDGSNDQVLTTDGDGNLTFTAKGSGGGGGTCYGVSTEGGLSLTSGLCFAVVAGNNIVVSSNGVSLDTSLTGIESITMTTGGVSFSSNDTFIGRDGTSLRLISHGTPFNFPGT